MGRLTGVTGVLGTSTYLVLSIHNLKSFVLGPPIRVCPLSLIVLQRSGSLILDPRTHTKVHGMSLMQ